MQLGYEVVWNIAGDPVVGKTHKVGNGESCGEKHKNCHRIFPFPDEQQQDIDKCNHWRDKH